MDVESDVGEKMRIRAMRGEMRGAMQSDEVLSVRERSQRVS